MKPAIHQIIPSIRSGDAVGNTTLRLRDTLRKLGYKSDIYRESCSPDLKSETLPAEKYLDVSDPENIVFFQYSIGSELGRFVYHLPDQIVLIYHNISPPDDFIGIHDHVVGELFHGRKQVAQFADRCLLGVSESEFNRQELVDMGFPRTALLPLAIDFDALNTEPDPFILDAYDDEKHNFLFVGRIVPNKGIEDLIKLYAHYKKFVSHDCRLIIAGDWSGFERYHGQLLKLIDSIDLPHVVMPGRVDFSQLLAFYRLASVYISMSKHEGFCVPLLEAMHFDVPVMALSAAAVPETMDGAGVLVNNLEFAEMAEMLDLLAQPGQFRDRIIESQQNRLQRYREVPFEEHLKRVLDLAMDVAEGKGK